MDLKIGSFLFYFLERYHLLSYALKKRQQMVGSDIMSILTSLSLLLCISYLVLSLICHLPPIIKWLRHTFDYGDFINQAIFKLFSSNHDKVYEKIMISHVVGLQSNDHFISITWTVPWHLHWWTQYGNRIKINTKPK